MKFMLIVLFFLIANVDYINAEKYNLLNLKDTQNNLIYSIWGERDVAVDNTIEQNLTDVEIKVENLQVLSNAYASFDTLNLYFVFFDKSEMSDETRCYIGIWNGRFFSEEDEVIMDYFPTIEQQKNIMNSISAEKDAHYKNTQFAKKASSAYDVWKNYYIAQKSRFQKPDSTSTTSE